MEKLQLYASSTYKNGVETQIFLKQDDLMTFTPTELDKNALTTEKEMLRIPANNTIKREELLKANL